MNQNFKHRCNRRRAHPFGAGSGGDSGEDGARMVTAEKTLVLSGNHVAVQADDPTPPATPDPPLITLLAADTTTELGGVEAHAGKAVRLTTGPDYMMHSDVTDGVDICVSETQSITLMRGALPVEDQTIQISPGFIMVDGGTGSITIQSMSEITIKVGETTSLMLTPLGIVVQGPLITMN
jgi:hypothetical protein